MNWDDSCCTLKLRLKAAASHKDDHFLRYCLVETYKRPALVFPWDTRGREAPTGNEEKAEFSSKADSAALWMWIYSRKVVLSLLHYLNFSHLTTLRCKTDICPLFFFFKEQDSLKRDWVMLFNDMEAIWCFWHKFSSGGFCEWCFEIYGVVETEGRPQLVFHLWQ